MQMTPKKQEASQKQPYKVVGGGRSMDADSDDGDDDEYQFPPSFPFFASLTNMYAAAADAAEGGKGRFTREA